MSPHAAKTREERLAKLVSKLDEEYQNYADSVLILSGISNHFQNPTASARFIGTNLPLKRLDQHESQPPRPDLVLQAKADTVGICFELKWALPHRPDNLRKELLSCQRYSQPRSGWRTADGTIPAVEVGLVASRDDCARVVQLMQSYADVRTLFSANVSLLSWDFSRTTETERLYVLKVTGGASVLDPLFSSPGLDLGKETLTHTFAKIQFYGAKPPLPYIMEKVYLLGNALKQFDTQVDVEIKGRTSKFFKQGILVTARELHAEQSSFFPAWERVDQDLPQIRLGWIQEALVGLVRIGLAIPIVALRPINATGTGAVLMRSSGAWQNNRSQLFFIPTRTRGADFRYQVIKSHARVQLAEIESENDVSPDS